MIRWSVTFFLIALIAAIFGFGGIVVGIAASIAKLFFFTAISLFVLSLMLSRSYHRR